MSMDKYKVDHLILLVNEKTRMNDVTLLVKLLGSVSLVCTKDGLAEAKKLRREMIKNKVVHTVNEPRVVDEYDAYEITQAINGILIDEVDDNVKIGIDYTHGTRTMAVHACVALRFSFNMQKQVYVERKNIQLYSVDGNKAIIENLPQKPLIFKLED